MYIYWSEGHEEMEEDTDSTNGDFPSETYGLVSLQLESKVVLDVSQLVKEVSPRKTYILFVNKPGVRVRGLQFTCFS